MDVSISYYTDRGGRTINQDAVSVQKDSRTVLAIVADGLGGHDAGEVASNQAVETITRMLGSDAPDREMIMGAICRANRDIHALQKPGQKMRTTVAALWIGSGTAVAANVGDTRIYQFRQGRIVYQSVDHSVAQMAVLLGEIQPDEIRESPDRNKLIRVLGDAGDPKIDAKSLSVQAGDRFLVCSDGFWEAVTEQDMIDALDDGTDPQVWLGKMRQKVDRLADGTHDNHTAVVLMIDEIERE